MRKGTGRHPKISKDAEDNAEQVDEVEGGVEVGLVDAWVYVWGDGLDAIEPDIWQ